MYAPGQGANPRMRLKISSAGRDQSIRPSSFFSMGAIEACALSCARGVSTPVAKPRSVSAIKGAPSSDIRAVSSGAVSAAPISISFCSNISPVSIPASIRIDVTPVFVSPFTMAQLMGAAPRYFGSSEACRLIQPSLGIGRSRAGMICPYAMMTIASGASF